MKPKSNKLAAPSMRRRNPDHDAYYKNRIKQAGLSPHKVEISKKRLLKEMKISEFKLNDIFFISVLRRKNFGIASTSLEMAISKLLSSPKPITLLLNRGLLTAHNYNKSIVVFMFEENGLVWASSEQLASVGYFKLDKPQYSAQYKEWCRQAIDSAVESIVLKESV